MDSKKIGNFIRELRKEKNLTQKQLAEKINITDKAISKWERGLSFPDITMLNVLCKELNVSVEELLNGEKSKNENNEKKDIIDIEKAIKEALENANHREEKRKQKIAKAKKITKDISIIFFVIFLIMQMMYLYASHKYNFEYIIDSLFYIVNEIIILTLFLFLIFTFKNKKCKVVFTITFLLFTIINIIFMGIYGFRNKSFVKFSSDLKYQFVVKQNRETNKISVYKNNILIFARPMETLAESANNVKVQWISRDIFSITYTNNENKLKEYVVSRDEDYEQSSYTSFEEALLGKWQSIGTNKTTRLYVDSKNIRLKVYDEDYTFNFEDCVQIRDAGIILYSNEIPRFIVTLSNNTQLDEKTGIIKKDGTIIISEISTDKTIKEELYCINPKGDDLSNYNYVNLSAKNYQIENGILYFSYDGIKTVTVPGDFSRIDSYEEGQYLISDDMIVFYYETKNGKYMVYSTDQGQNWYDERMDIKGNIQSIQFPTQDIGYILTFSDVTMGDARGSIYKTSNRGINWEEVSNGIDNGDFVVFSSGTKIFFPTESVGFFTMPDVMGEKSDLYMTRDGGKTFQKLDLATNPDCDYYHLPTSENGEIHIKITVGYANNESAYKTVENFVSKNNGETFEKE